MGRLTNLEVLFLYENQLSGAIPPELGQLTNLKLLAMHDNQLSGEVPEALRALANLIAITVCEANQLTCDIGELVAKGVGVGVKTLFDVVGTTGGAIGDTVKRLFGGWW